jgi:hypothetical protein
MNANSDGEHRIKQDGKPQGVGPITSMLAFTTERVLALIVNFSASSELKIQAIRSLLKSLVVHALYLILLGGAALAVYLVASKAVGEASNLISSIAGAIVAALAAYYLLRAQKIHIETHVDMLRELEKDLYKRLDREIKSIVTKAR